MKYYPYPYIKEKFTKREISILQNFFTNIDKPVFAIHNLPQEVVGALFSRYSRSEKNIRRLFLDEFWDSSFSSYSLDPKKLKKAQERTSSFYKKVYAEFGDDSVIQMGSVHIAFEFVSQIAAKVIEDQRIGAAYIERSTRYVNFGTNAGGRFLFMDVPEIKESTIYKEYLKWNNTAFELYNKSFVMAMAYLKKKYPIESQIFETISTGSSFRFSKIKDLVEKEKLERAYDRALRAKAFDTVRIFLPTTSVTNLGAHFSGQAAEHAINKMLCSKYAEVRLLGEMAYQELVKITPNFLQNIKNHRGEVTRSYLKEISSFQEKVVNNYVTKIKLLDDRERVKLVDWDREADVKIVSQILYSAQTKTYFSKNEFYKWAKKKENGNKVLKILESGLPDRSLSKYNRRHKLPRAFEQAFAEIEFFVDFGIYRDLQRHRMSSAERLYLIPELLEVPSEFTEAGMEGVYKDYLTLNKMTINLYKKVKKYGPGVSEYITILGNKLRFNVRANIRQWVFFSELRTMAGGHPAYRNAMQLAVKQIISKNAISKKIFCKSGLGTRLWLGST